MKKGLAIKVFQRDRWKCRNESCGSREGLHPHHIIYKSHGGPDTMDNLVTVCHECHRRIHDGELFVRRDPLRFVNKGVTE
jgi:5-methylcytosine-specific restriction endonuclease McrA